MHIQEFANMLDGREYHNEITKQEEQLAKELGYVVVFGYSDDNMEFRGAIYDEVGCFDGGSVYIDQSGIIESCECECRHYERAIKKAKEIEAIWCPNDRPWSWIYNTPIPHETFEIFDDGEEYCLGIVFDLNRLEKTK